MRRISVTAAVLSILPVPALAADPFYNLPAAERPLYNWGGGYAGLHGGYLWSRADLGTGGGGTGTGLIDGILGGTITDLIGPDGLLGATVGDLGLGTIVDDLVGDLDLIDGVLGDLLGDLGVDLGADLEGVLGDALAAADITLDVPGADLSSEMEGFFGGAHLGYNFQSGSMVFGLEGNISLANLSESSTISASTPVVLASAELLGLEILDITGEATLEAETETNLNWFGTLAGRVGIAHDRVLFFGTGGLAFGDVEYAASIVTGFSAEVDVIGIGIVDLDIPGVTATASASDTMFGYTIGGGIEYAISDAWTTKLEYSYVNLGTMDVAFSDGSTSEIEVDMHLVKVGLSYRF